MVRLVYDNTFEGFLTAVFIAYERRLPEVVIVKEQEETVSIFGDSLIIVSDEEKAQRVWKGLVTIMGTSEVQIFWKAWLSELEEVDEILLNVLQYAFANKKNILSDFSNPFVVKLHQVHKKVGREKHRMEAFVRFELTKDGFYYAAIQPDFNVLPLIISHFQNRYADQKWLIYDTRRDYGIYYDLETIITVKLDWEEGNGEALEENEELYQTLWKDYFKNTNIEARKNAKLHLRHVPKRYWKFLTEKR